MERAPRWQPQTVADGGLKIAWKQRRPIVHCVGEWRDAALLTVCGTQSAALSLRHSVRPSQSAARPPLSCAPVVRTGRTSTCCPAANLDAGRHAITSGCPSCWTRPIRQWERFRNLICRILQPTPSADCVPQTALNCTGLHWTALHCPQLANQTPDPRQTRSDLGQWCARRLRVATGAQLAHNWRATGPPAAQHNCFHTEPSWAHSAFRHNSTN